MPALYRYILYIITSGVRVTGLLLLAAGVTPLQAQLAPLDRTLDRALEGPLDRVRDRRSPIDDRVDEELGDAVDDAVAEPAGTLDDTATEPALDGTVDAGTGAAAATAGDALEQGTAAAGAVAATVGQTAQAALAAVPALADFVSDIDPTGATIEKNVLMVLADSRELAAVTGYGLDIIEQRPLAGLGLTLLKLAAPVNRDLAIVALDLRLAAAGAAVDYNHLYRPVSGAAPEAAQPGPRAERGIGEAAALRIGIIDSAVAPDHPSLSGTRVTTRDFASHKGARPMGHGTAVASVIAGAAGERAELLAASVFFQLPKHAPGATTGSLVAALDWLAAEQVDAINMSLAGPANALLERALQGMDGNAPPVIAAVGNNGPAGEPLYPAAYEPVIGVTAIDRDRRIFHYANRGDHVAFAAAGVNVRVADLGGGWRIESGTSMASPLVTLAAARSRHAGARDRRQVIDALIAAAEDLGPQGFDTVFGYGQIREPDASAPGTRAATRN